MALFYVNPNIERAIGIDLDMYPDAFLISNTSPLAELLKQKYPERILLNVEGNLSTVDLLRVFALDIEKVGERDREILVFKNSVQIERFCEEKEWTLLNAPSDLVNRFERKIDQYQWLSESVPDVPLSDTRIVTLGQTNYDNLADELGEPFVMQYNTGHTGSSTLVVNNGDIFEIEQERFPQRPTKCSRYIAGTYYTLVACVMKKEVLHSAISEQITGVYDLTGNPLATVGNDWACARGQLTGELVSQIKEMALSVGISMYRDGWKGLFGIDVVVEGETGSVYLLEVNARQQSSASFETQLAHLHDASGPMDWQLAALTARDLRPQISNLKFDASQIFLRKADGEVAKKFDGITKVGEYGQDLKLVQEKALFDLPQDSENLFLIPQCGGQSEILRIQALFSLNKSFGIKY